MYNNKINIYSSSMKSKKYLAVLVGTLSILILAGAGCSSSKPTVSAPADQSGEAEVSVKIIDGLSK